MQEIDIYVDGSFKNGRAIWGFIVIKNNKIIYKDRGIILDCDINSIWQVGGEMLAVVNAISWCIKNKYKANIFYDFKGLRAWIADIFSESPWKARNEWTQEYRKFCLTYKRFIKSFNKVKSHNGDKYNEMVDEYINQKF